jgi:SAM-dependent methyltransferase
MNWTHKAAIMRICAGSPNGSSVYRIIQRMFGRLTADPYSRLKAQTAMVRSLVEAGATIEGKTIFEVGTGHLPVVPVGFYLCGASSVDTVDLNRRLDLALFKRTMYWFSQNSELVVSMYADLVASSDLRRRMLLINKHSSDPMRFLLEANIRYSAPADAASTPLSKDSIDYHVSNTVLEHIPKDDIAKIFIECRRILKRDGMAIHFIDLSDHFQHQDRSITKINFLHYREEEWMKIAGNQFAYCNRLRASEFRTIFHDLNFKVIKEECVLDGESVNSIEKDLILDDKFRTADVNDLCTVSMHIVMRRG